MKSNKKENAPAGIYEKEIENRVCELFNNSDKAIVIDEERKKNTIILLKEKVTQKQIYVVNNKKRILLNQLKYMDKSIFVIHLLICIFVLIVMALMSRRGMEEEEIILISGALSGFLGIISIVEISRVFSSGIAELSESCYFNVRQIVAFNMLMAGIINLTLLSVEIIFMGYRWEIELVRAALYILVPCIFTECCCLGVLFFETGRRRSYLLVMAGTFSIVFFLILASRPQLYRAAAMTVWGAALMAGLFILGMQIGILFKGIKKGEIICMN